MTRYVVQDVETRLYWSGGWHGWTPAIAEARTFASVEDAWMYAFTECATLPERIAIQPVASFAGAHLGAAEAV